MGIDNALIAAEFIDCQTIIGMHYDTFGYITIDTKEAVAKFQMAGNDLHLFSIGETKNI
jgi:L-ascorbate metabolism protein UlaG (beta-lactamase superfamily)